MADSNRGGARGVWIAAVLVLLGAGIWIAMNDSSESPEPGTAPESGAGQAAPEASAAPSAAPAIPSLRIATSGRLSVVLADHPEGEPLALALDLPDEARGEDDHAVRIVSVDGRRLDASASPLPGSGSGVRLEIEPGFLAPGRYMIEVDSAEAHPLRIVRFVLEVQ